jgi:hypothetical protein
MNMDNLIIIVTVVSVCGLIFLLGCYCGEKIIPSLSSWIAVDGGGEVSVSSITDAGLTRLAIEAYFTKITLFW